MSVTLYFGIRLAGRPYQSIAHKLKDEEYSTVENLKKIVVSEILRENCPANGVELVYGGSVLDDSAELKEEGIEPGCTIHVFEKNVKAKAEPIPITEESIARASQAYRYLCFHSTGYTFPKVIRPEVLSKVLEKYPELYNDLGAFAILKDPVLLEQMVRSQQVQKMGEKYPILVHSAKFVADTILSHSNANPILTAPTPRYTTAEDSLSDSSTENDSPQASPSHSDNQRISRDQLAAALLLAGSNSLSNIVPRSSGDEEMATTSTTATSSLSMGDAVSSTVQSSDNNQQYAAELQTMREMGLTEENSNLQALILCNGNVEAAVNLVLGIGNFA